MPSTAWIMTGCLLAAIAVLLGAFGAHGLEQRLAERGYAPEEVEMRIDDRYEPAVRYQLVHALALVLVGLWQERTTHTVQSRRLGSIAGYDFLIGILIFSGLLYVLTFTGPDYRFLGAIVPLGGLLLVAGWVALAISAYKSPPT